MRLDLGADGKFEQKRKADSKGVYRFASRVGFGATAARVVVSAPGKRAATASLIIARPVPLPPDTTPPAIALDPLPGGLVTRSSPTLAGRMADDRPGTISLTMQVDSGAPQPVPLDGARRFTIAPSLPAGGSADGPHVVRLVASDASGNISTAVESGFRLDTVAPSLSIESPGQGAISASNLTLEGDVTDANAGVTSLLLQVDGGAPQAVAIAGGRFAVATTLATDGSADGDHVARLTAVDAVGNASAATALIFRPDTRAPSIAIDAPPPGVTRSNVTVAGRAVDALTGVAGLTFQVDSGPKQLATLDGAGRFAITTALPTDGSADGLHVVSLAAVDAVGNTSTPTSLGFTPDARTPSVVAGPLGDGERRLLGIPRRLQRGDGPVGLLGRELRVAGRGGPNDGDAVPITAVTRASATEARIAVATPLANESYRLAVAGSAADLAGNALAAPREFAFEVLDPAGIADSSPSDGEGWSACRVASWSASTRRSTRRR